MESQQEALRRILQEKQQQRTISTDQQPVQGGVGQAATTPLSPAPQVAPPPVASQAPAAPVAIQPKALAAGLGTSLSPAASSVVAQGKEPQKQMLAGAKTESQASPTPPQTLVASAPAAPASIFPQPKAEPELPALAASASFSAPARPELPGAMAEAKPVVPLLPDTIPEEWLAQIQAQTVEQVLSALEKKQMEALQRFVGQFPLGVPLGLPQMGVAPIGNAALPSLPAEGPPGASQPVCAPPETVPQAEPKQVQSILEEQQPEKAAEMAPPVPAPAIETFTAEPLEETAPPEPQHPPPRVVTSVQEKTEPPSASEIMGRKNAQSHVLAMSRNDVKNEESEKIIPAGTKKSSALQAGLDAVTGKINKLTGNEGAVDIRLRDLFSSVFQKHTREESEAIFIAGTATTTPKETEIATSWPRPWLFSRVLASLLAACCLLYLVVALFGNLITIPALVFVGAMAMPFSVLIFFYETNAPRNISIFEVVKMFAIGGGFSLVFTMLLFFVVGSGGMGYAGALIVGFVEEVGKVLAVAVFVKALNPKYILNGILIGAAVGAGFAVFETAGYAFFYADDMLSVLFMRGWSSVGAHVVWAAISGAGLLLVKGDFPFQFGMLTHGKFLPFLLAPILMHATWNSPFLITENSATMYLKMLLLIVVAWLFVLVLLSAGLRQIKNGGPARRVEKALSSVVFSKEKQGGQL